MCLLARQTKHIDNRHKSFTINLPLDSLALPLFVDTHIFLGHIVSLPDQYKCLPQRILFYYIFVWVSLAIYNWYCLCSKNFQDFRNVRLCLSFFKEFQSIRIVTVCSKGNIVCIFLNNRRILKTFFHNRIRCFPKLFANMVGTNGDLRMSMHLYVCALAICK